MPAQSLYSHPSPEMQRSYSGHARYAEPPVSPRRPAYPAAKPGMARRRSIESAQAFAYPQRTFEGDVARDSWTPSPSRDATAAHFNPTPEQEERLREDVERAMRHKMRSDARSVRTRTSSFASSFSSGVSGRSVSSASSAAGDNSFKMAQSTSTGAHSFASINSQGPYHSGMYPPSCYKEPVSPPAYASSGYPVLPSPIGPARASRSTSSKLREGLASASPHKHAPPGAMLPPQGTPTKQLAPIPRYDPVQHRTRSDSLSAVVEVDRYGAPVMSPHATVGRSSGKLGYHDRA